MLVATAEDHKDWYISLEAFSENSFVSLYDTLLRNVQVAKGVTNHTISASIVDHELWLELLEAGFHGGANHLAELIVCGSLTDSDVILDKLLRVRVSWVDIVVVGIDDVELV